MRRSALNWVLAGLTGIVPLAVASCATAPLERDHASSALSFDQYQLPSLMDINQGRCRTEVASGIFRLNNVHPSFGRSFVLVLDESRQSYIIRDTTGRIVFEGDLPGIPRFLACVDIGADGTPDVVVRLASFGNRSGAECFLVLMNRQGRLTPLEGMIEFTETCGQEGKAGVLTWYSAATHVAIFVGEEADITGEGSEDDPLAVGEIRKVREVWGRKDGALRLVYRSSVPIAQREVPYLTFR